MKMYFVLMRAPPEMRFGLLLSGEREGVCRDFWRGEPAGSLTDSGQDGISDGHAQF
jgi:hypothetical protein